MPQNDDPGAMAPAHSAGWVARRLGITPATLRSWHHRYGVGPTQRSTGGHRRYGSDDVERLERMRRMVVTGVPVAEAARASENAAFEVPEVAIPRRRGGGRVLAVGSPGQPVRELASAAMALDQPAAARMIGTALRRRGVVYTWTHLLVPVLQGIGDRYERSGDCIDVEHMFSECVRGALVEISARSRRWVDLSPVLLASAEDDQHTLALHAVAAALAEQRRPFRMLGAGVPPPVLAAAVRRTAPSAVFVWSQRTGTARSSDLDAVPRTRPPLLVVVGGPGWLDDRPAIEVRRVENLDDAVAALCGLTT